MRDLRKLLSELGLPVPAPIQRIEDLASALAVATQPRSFVLAEEILDGTATPANVAKKLHVAALDRVSQSAALEIYRELTNTIETARARAIRSAAPEIVDALRAPFDQAAASLALSVEQLGPRPNQQAILKAGPLAMANWESRKRASSLLDKVRAIRVTLADARWGPRTQTASWYVLEVKDMLYLDYGDRALRLGGIVGLVDEGFPLHLNDQTEITSLETTAQAVTDEQQTTAQDEAMSDARAHGQRLVRGWKDLIEEAARARG